MPEQTTDQPVSPSDQRLTQVEQQLADLQRRLQDRGDELATAEAQRDEARQQVTLAENRIASERLLGKAGVVDIETASLLLSRRLDLNEDLGAEALARGVEELLLDKPFLRAAAPAPLPPKTASAKSPGMSLGAKLAQSAERAARTGDRRDVAEYLRLRRRLATSRSKS